MMPRILVVEDEIITRIDLVETLRELDYRVVADTGSGEIAVSLAAEQRPDIVLMDISLKGKMDGIEAAERLNSELQVPVVFLTANDKEEALERAKLVMPFGYLIKPVTPRELKSAIEIALHISREREQALADLRERERQLRQEKRRLERYLDIAPVIILIIDANSQVGLINRAGCELLGYAENDIVGRCWFDHFLPEADRDAKRLIFQRLLTAGTEPQRLYAENPVLTRSGEERLIAWDCTVLPDENGRCAGVLGCGLDITERKRAEAEVTRYQDRLEELVVQRTNALKGLLQEKETLLQEINHRVKNNLSMIIGMIHEEQDKAEIQGRNGAQHILHRLSGRVEALFTVHRLMSLRGWQWVELPELCTEIIAGVLKTSTLEPVQVDIAPSSIRIDARQAHHLTLVINELAVNSLKHAGAFKADLQFGIRMAALENQVHLTYQDNGPGFPDRILSGDPQHRKTGLELIFGIVTHSLAGQVRLHNDQGAVTTIVFKQSVLPPIPDNDTETIAAR